MDTSLHTKSNLLLPRKCPSIRSSKSYCFDLFLFFSLPLLADEERSLSAPSLFLPPSPSVPGGSTDSLCLADLLVGGASWLWALTALALSLGFFMGASGSPSSDSSSFEGLKVSALRLGLLLGASGSSSSDSSSFEGLKVSALRFTDLWPVILLASGCCIVLVASVSCRRFSEEVA